MRSVFEYLKSVHLRIALFSFSIFFFCFNQIALPQYAADYTDLLHTTYTRQFDRPIILNYLHSADQRKINAALLSISNSQDTLFVNDIINSSTTDIDLKIFCLESFGECFQSSNYFWKSINLNPDSSYKYFIGLSRTGNQKDLDKIIEKYSNGRDDKKIPFSLILLNFTQRGYKTLNQNELIYKELLDTNLGKSKLSFLIYPLSRLETDKKILSKITEIIKLDLFAHNDIDLFQFALLTFRKNKFFPDEDFLFNFFINNNNILIRALTTSAVCYKRNFSKLELEKYFRLLYDSTETTARQTAISLKYLTLEDSLIGFIENNLITALGDQTISSNVRGELLNSYSILFKDKFVSIEPNISKDIPAKFRIRSFSNFNSNEKYLKELIQYFDNGDELIKIESLNSLILFLENDSFKAELSEVLLSALKSNSPALISIAADAIDSVFISQNGTAVREIINQQINSSKDDYNFTESLISLINLSARINSEFHLKILKSLQNTAIYSIKNLVDKKLEIKSSFYKDDFYFEELIQNAFAYSAAEINTNKGTFIIKFSPETAPISCGNFIKLVEENFYGGIRFHRVVPGFVIQVGDKSSTGWQGPGYEIISEFSNNSFRKGTVGMASSGKDTEGSQFFVMLGSYPHLDGKYTNFAKVDDGMDVVYKIDEDDIIISIKLLDKIK